MSKVSAPYGSWPSPYTSELLTGDVTRVSACRFDGASLYWLESRPSESGRTVLVRHSVNGGHVDVTPPAYDVRSRVHEYGGGAFDVHGEVVVFVNQADQRIYRLNTRADQAVPQAITPDGPFRYGDLRLDPQGRRLLCVREDHDPAHREPVNTIVSVDVSQLNDDGGRVVVSGPDFVASPELDRTGDRLAWVSWDHPNMPWDGTELWTGQLGDDGRLDDVRNVAGGPGESVHDPRWAPDGRLAFLSDRTGWWNLYVLDVTDPHAEATPMCRLDTDFGVPPGLLGVSGYGFTTEGHLLCQRTERGVDHLELLDPANGNRTPVDVDAMCLHGVAVGANAAATIAVGPTTPLSVIRLSLPGLDSEVVRRSTTHEFSTADVSVPEPVEWSDADGRPVHGFLYSPENEGFQGPDDELPPLLLLSHGGPTGRAIPGFSVDVQYWTSRGFAVLDVNYGGSLGYGRQYRDRLTGLWGVVDVADCASGAVAMADQGRVDPARLAIRGGSAGGYTTLSALAFTDVFQAGASYFGVSDLETLARDTHKFESRYLDRLVGPYPQRRERYVERSPIHQLDSLTAPMVLFQGTEDKVVPPDQAQSMAAAVRAKGLPVALLMFDGEGHGFRRAESIRRAVEAELYFYGRVFGFDPADQLEPIWIDNLDTSRSR